jgi:hypothetical protein
MVRISKAWKDHEKRAAASIDGQRTSRPYANLPDAVSGQVIVECKTRKALPQWLWRAVEQAQSYIANGELAVVSLHEKRRHQQNDLAVLKWPDFVRLIEKAGLLNGRVSESKLPE